MTNRINPQMTTNREASIYRMTREITELERQIAELEGYKASGNLQPIGKRQLKSAYAKLNAIKAEFEG